MDMDFASLKIFCAVLEQGSFSAAARTLGITQPTVSQKIAKLETELGVRLFERVGHDIHITESGRKLHQMAIEVIEQQSRFLEDMKNEKESPKGTVRYAMAESCQWTPHYRKIMSQIREFPNISFEIGILPNDQIVQRLLEGKIDFGFIVGDRLNPELRFEKFSDEEYSPVAASQDLLKPIKNSEPEALRLIAFPGWELFFSTWVKSSGLWNKFKNRINNPTVFVGTLAGAVHACQEGAGVAIIPTQCSFKDVDEKTLKEFQSGKANKPSNAVHVARRLGEKLPRRSEVVLELLRQAKQELG